MSFKLSRHLYDSPNKDITNISGGQRKMLAIAYISFPDNSSCMCRNSRSSLSRDLFIFVTKAFHESLSLEIWILRVLLDAVRMMVKRSDQTKGIFRF